LLGPSAALASAIEGLLCVDRFGVFSYANPAAERILGASAAEISGSSPRSWNVSAVDGKPIDADDLPALRLLRTGEPHATTEHSIERADGTRSVVSHTATLVRTSCGSVEGAVVSLLETDAQHVADERLRRAEVDFRAFIESSPEGIVMHRDGRVVYGNPALATMLGFDKAEDLVGLPILDHVHPEDRSLVRERMGILATGRPIPLRAERLLHRDGHDVDVEVSALPILGRGDPLYLAFVNDVSARTRVQRELDHSVSLLRATLDAAAEGILVVDHEGRIRVFNEKFVDMWRIPQSIMDLRDDDRAVAYVLDQVENKDVFLGPMRQLSGDAQRHSHDFIELTGGRTFERRSEPQRIGDRSVGRVWSFLHVTERRHAEAERERLLAEIAAKHELLRTVIDNAPVGIALSRGSDLVYDMVNPAFERMMGTRLRVGRSVEAVTPDNAAQLAPILQRVLETGEPFRGVDVPYVIRRDPDAPPVDAFFWATYLRVATKHGPAILALLVDTTEQVQARRRIEDLATVAQRQSAELQHIHSSMVDSVVVCDAGGQITHINHAETRLTGLEPNDVLHHSLCDYAKMLDLRHLDKTPFKPNELPLARALAGETVMSAPFVSERTGHKVYMRSNATAIRDAAGEIVGAVAVDRDVSQAFEFDVLKDQFIRVAAHELKTPVAIMKGYAELLLRSSDQVPAALAGGLQAIDRGAKRIDRLVSDLLDVSQLQLGRMEIRREKVDLAELVDVVTRRASLTSKKHEITIVESEPIVVNADRVRLERVLDKLLDNAIRYSPRGGAIEVRVSTRDDAAVVCVRDHGVGIPRAKQGRIFERFYRAHTDTPHDYGGMGVGLYISREIVTQHGGTMWFESTEGSGSNFCFSLRV
jgi:PAS domain S-box-containing protein